MILRGSTDSDMHLFFVLNTLLAKLLTTFDPPTPVHIVGVLILLMVSFILSKSVLDRDLILYSLKDYNYHTYLLS